MMKQYEITVTWDGGVVQPSDKYYLAMNDLVIGRSSKRILKDEAIADIVKYGFKSVIIKQGYYVEIIVG
jgi:hypothetical protein